MVLRGAELVSCMSSTVNVRNTHLGVEVTVMTEILTNLLTSFFIEGAFKPVTQKPVKR